MIPETTRIPHYDSLSPDSIVAKNYTNILKRQATEYGSVQAGIDGSRKKIKHIENGNLIGFTLKPCVLAVTNPFAVMFLGDGFFKTTEGALQRLIEKRLQPKIEKAEALRLETIQTVKELIEELKTLQPHKIHPSPHTESQVTAGEEFIPGAEYEPLNEEEDKFLEEFEALITSEENEKGSLSLDEMNKLLQLQAKRYLAAKETIAESEKTSWTQSGVEMIANIAAPAALQACGVPFFTGNAFVNGLINLNKQRLQEKKDQVVATAYEQLAIAEKESYEIAKKMSESNDSAPGAVEVQIQESNDIDERDFAPGALLEPLNEFDDTFLNLCEADFKQRDQPVVINTIVEDELTGGTFVPLTLGQETSDITATRL